MQKLVKARKEHKCVNCEHPIAKGEPHLFISLRLPKLETVNDWDKLDQGTSDKQIGVEFMKFRQHDYNCHWPFQCQLGNHEYEYCDGMMGDVFITAPYWICKNCGESVKYRPDVSEIQQRDLDNIELTGYSNNG